MKYNHGGFPGGSVVENPPANVGDTGLIPGPGSFHMSQDEKNTDVTSGTQN